VALQLAWFSPWPPQRSGVAGRSAELSPLLAANGHAIDVFVDASLVSVARGAADAPAPGTVRVLSAHEFVWRHARGDYHLPIYQVGNSHLHRFIWPYLFRHPGLVVMHDGRIHHARAEALISRERFADYRAEFGWSHPGADPAGAGFGVLGLDGPFLYHWPMNRGVIAAARLVAAHSRGLVRAIARDWPDRPVEHIALGEGPATFDHARARARVRSAHGIGPDTVLFGVFGGLTGEKLVPEILAAFRDTRAWTPDAALLLVGTADPCLDLDDRIVELGPGSAVRRVDAATDAEFDEAIAAVDVMLNLRWPTALETSGPWVRGLALGRPTVIVDLPHQTHVPALDPRTWRRHAPCEDLSEDADARAVTVAIDICDLPRLLRVAMRRLGTDAALRARLGREARAWWEREHTVTRMVADYERAMERAITEPPPSPDWPAHMRPDPAAHARRILADPALADNAVAQRLSGF
jgi:glycosyltransferase involved in cell wall biosynthesis